VHPSSAANLETLDANQNPPTGAALNRPNHIVNAPGDFTVNAFDLRVDQTLTASQKIFGRFTSKIVDSTGPPESRSIRCRATPFSNISVRQVAASHNFVVRSNPLNEARGGFAYTLEESGYPLAGPSGFPAFDFAVARYRTSSSRTLG
jgi:hypothetical protein